MYKRQVHAVVVASSVVAAIVYFVLGAKVMVLPNLDLQLLSPSPSPSMTSSSPPSKVVSSSPLPQLPPVAVVSHVVISIFFMVLQASSVLRS